MGMYDEVICNYPLPEAVPAYINPGHRFQTKDLDCQLATYTIGEDGRIDIPDYTGSLDFYTSNWCAISAGMIFTHDGADFEEVEYRAEFTASRLTCIVRSGYERQPALPSSAMHAHARGAITPDEVRASNARDNESLVGRSVYILWGGHDVGYGATVVAESDREICVKSATGKLEVLHRCQRDVIFFDSESAAMESRAADKAKREADRAEYQKLLDAKAVQ